MIILHVRITDEGSGRLKQELWGEEAQMTKAEADKSLRIRTAIERELGRPMNKNNCIVTIAGPGAEAMVKRLANEREA